MFSIELIRKIDGTDPKLKEIFISLMTEIRQVYVTEKKVDDLGNTFKSEFGELKSLVRDLVLAQQRTDRKFEELAQSHNELAQAHRELAESHKGLAEAQRHTEKVIAELSEAQKHTEKVIAELFEAQKHTEKVIAELSEAQKNTEKEIAKLSKTVGTTRDQIGGLSKSVAYALENEAYRNLPSFLSSTHRIEITERFVRTEIRGEEINLFAKARRNGDEVLIVGETVLRLDDRSKMKQLNRKMKVVGEHYPGCILIPLIITHFARPDILKAAAAKKVVVVQSFEWK